MVSLGRILRPQRSDTTNPRRERSERREWRFYLFSHTELRFSYLPLKLPSPVRHSISCSLTLGNKGPTCLFFTRRSSNSRTQPRTCVLTSGCRAGVPGRKTTRKGPGRRWTRRAQPNGLNCASRRGARAHCAGLQDGLGAKTRLSRLVLNFLPSAPADSPLSPLALRGSLRRQGWGRRRSGRDVCAHGPDTPSRPPFFLLPPPPPITS